MSPFRKIGNFLLQLLFPLRCPVCDRIVPTFGEKICLECMKIPVVIGADRCEKCGKKLMTRQKLCKDCRQREHFFIRGRSLYEYQSIADGVYRFKYGGRKEYADFFGREIALYLGEFINNTAPDALVPIPLHKRRLKARGYNQAAVLAKAIGRYSKIPVEEHFLVRVKNTRPLKAQNPKERQNNLKKAFIIGQNDVKLETIIIIDDIYTTGSTIDEAAQVCMQAGVKNIYFITLAGGESV